MTSKINIPEMKYLIVGLGNIGKEYEHTRHNIGFDILDSFAKEAGVEFKIERHAFYAEAKHAGKTLILIKPTTYMNLSGTAVKYWASAEGIEPPQILVLTDDLALPIGTLRLRKKGGDGSHNGLTSIIASLGRNDFPRMRFGIGNDFRRGYQADFVLSQWKNDEQALVDEKIQISVELIKDFVKHGVDNTMNKYNSLQ